VLLSFINMNIKKEWGIFKSNILASHTLDMYSQHAICFFPLLMRSTRDGPTNSTVSCGLQNDVISSHEDVTLAATFLSSGHRNAGGQRIFLTCGSKFHLILLLFLTPTNHISRISGSDTVVAHIFRPISFITTRTMELLNGRIREMSHDAGDSCLVL